MSDAKYYAERAKKHAPQSRPELERIREVTRMVLRVFPGSRVESYGEIRK